jgi:hypothetical protein
MQLKNLIPLSIRQKIGSRPVKSYSQEGEDMILRYIFDRQKTGFYVDVGAYHSKRFSNTYYFYKRGWRGINIDPNLKIKRSRDINLKFGIGEEKKLLTYYVFSEPALNTFNRELAQQRNKGKYKIIGTKEVLVKPLRFVLDRYCKCEIDFLNIDAEGMDLEVLKSNDWTRFKPKVILVEGGTDYLKDYELIAKTVNTYIYKLK